MAKLKHNKTKLDRGFTRSTNNTQYLPQDKLNFLQRNRQKWDFLLGHISKMTLLQEIFIYHH